MDGTKQQTDWHCNEGNAIANHLRQCNNRKETSGGRNSKHLCSLFHNYLKLASCGAFSSQNNEWIASLKETELAKDNFIAEGLNSMISHFRAKQLKVPFRDTGQQKIFDPQEWDDTVNMHIE